MKPTKKSTYAFFDIDGTLVNFQSTKAFLNELLKGRHVRLLFYFKALYWIYLYKRNKLDLEETFKAAMKEFEGKSVDLLHQISKKCFGGRSEKYP